MKTNGETDSKFKFVIFAAKRAKELLRGAKPLIETKSRNPIRIAQDEVAQKAIEYLLVPFLKEHVVEPEEEEAHIEEKFEPETEEGVAADSGEEVEEEELAELDESEEETEEPEEEDGEGLDEEKE